MCIYWYLHLRKRKFGILICFIEYKLCLCIYYSFDSCSNILLSGFIGYASVFHQVVADHAIEDVEDDQLYYTKIFLDKHKRVR